MVLKIWNFCKKRNKIGRFSKKHEKACNALSSGTKKRKFTKVQKGPAHIRFIALFRGANFEP